MKSLIIIAVLCILSVSCKSQVKQDASGNYIQVDKAKVPGTNTGKTYTDTKGTVYPVLSNAKGKLYVVKQSKKTGKEYKSYLKLENN